MSTPMERLGKLTHRHRRSRRLEQRDVGQTAAIPHQAIRALEVLLGHREDASDDDFRFAMDATTSGQVILRGEFYDDAQGQWYTGGMQMVIDKDGVTVSFLEDTGGGNTTIHGVYRFDKTDFSFNSDVENPNAFDQQGTMTLGVLEDLELHELLRNYVANG